jgi:hypothetical protein
MRISHEFHTSALRQLFHLHTPSSSSDYNSKLVTAKIIQMQQNANSYINGAQFPNDKNLQ